MAERADLRTFYQDKHACYGEAPGADNAHGKIPPLVGTGQLVLDVGCGSGQLGAAIRARGNEVVGLEISPAAAEHARARLDRVHVGSIEQGPVDEPIASFDVIVCADILEHLFDPGVALRALGAYLKPGGAFVVSLPNVAHFSLRWELFRGRFEYTDIGLLDRGHIRLFTRASAERLIEDAGLAIEHTDVTLSVPFAPPPVRRVIDLVARLPYRFRLRWSGLLAAQFVFVARPCDHRAGAAPVA